jgi:lactocepin
MKKVLGVFVVISIIISLLAGLAFSTINASNTDPIIEQAKLARENYIKSNLKLPDKSNLPGKGLTAPTDGPIIPEDVKNTELYKSGWIKVSVDADGASLTEYAISKGKTTKNIDKNEAKVYVNTLKVDHSYLKNIVSANGIGMRDVKDLFVAYNGFSAEVQVKDLNKLISTFGANRVHVATLYKITDEYSNALIGADTVWTDPGVDGEGMYVGILDTGVDYTHPDLGGNGTDQGFPTAKVVAGYSFEEDNPDPMDCNGHGTHVAGIIAADGAVQGVAPKAKIVFAKIVLGCEGSAWDTTIAEAFDYMADPDNLDDEPEGTHPPVASVNMSFGADSGFVDPNAPDQKAIENCISNGIIISLSAGNDYDSYTYNFGYYPFFPDYATVGSPAVTPNAIAVGASWNTVGKYVGYKVGDTDTHYGYTVAADGGPDPTTVFGLTQDIPYVYCGLGTPAEITAAGNISGKIALITRGLSPDKTTSSFHDKAYNAQVAGAIGVIIYNDGANANRVDLMGITVAGAPPITIPVVFSNYTQGNDLMMHQSSYKTVRFDGAITEVPISLADKMVDFSSWGPPPDLSFKPDITAPGGAIWSTVPVAMGSYANYSGTSMAAPHIAACAALLMEEHPDWTPKQVKIALMNTAELLTDPMSGLPYSPHLMGTGRVNVYNALKNNVTLTEALSKKPYVALGDIPNYKKTPIKFTLQLSNNGNSDVTYSISSTAQNTYFYLYSNSLGNIISTQPSGSIPVPAGKTKTVVVTIDARGVEDWNGWPYIEGFVSFTPQGSGVPLHIPYMGFLGNWNDFNEANWQFNPVIDPPADNPLTFTGIATWPEWYDGTDWYLTGVDFYGNFDRNTIAFNPFYYYLEADLWLLRNAENLTISITDPHGKVINTIDSVDQLYKMNWYSYNPYTGYPWLWDGTVLNKSKHGSMEPVADGLYHLVYTATAPKQFDKGSFDQPQVIDFPVMLDTQNPTVTITGQTNNGDGTSTITWSTADPAPSSGIWGYAVVINDDFSNINWVPPTENSYNVPNGSLVYVFAFDNANNLGNVTTTAP